MTETVRDDDLQVLVVGAGVGGLSLAGHLQRAGLEPVVVERGETLNEGDGVVELWPDAIAALARLDVAEAVREAGTHVTEWSLRRPDGTVRRRLEAGADPGLVVVRYARLRERLADVVTDGVVRTGTALRTLEDTGTTVTAGFASGIREQFDVVVGADGVRSRTRTLLDGGRAVPWGTVSLWFPLDPGSAPGGVTEVWTPGGAVYRVLPAGTGPVGCLTVPVDGRAESVPEGVTDLLPEIEYLPGDLADRHPEEVTAVADLRVTSDVRADGRVALLGDAARTLHRLSGAGVALAADDAAALQSVLVQREGDPATRLADYATARRTRLHRDVLAVDPSPPLSAVDSALADRHPAIPRLRSARLRSAFPD